MTCVNSQETTSRLPKQQKAGLDVTQSHLLRGIAASQTSVANKILQQGDQEFVFYNDVNSQQTTSRLPKQQKAGLDVVQCHPLYRTCFNQYQASSAVLAWVGDGDCYLCTSGARRLVYSSNARVLCQYGVGSSAGQGLA